MNTLEMINDWKESDCKKKYIRKSPKDKLPYTVHNNGVDVLFHSYLVVTLKNPIEESGPFFITKNNLDWQWEEVVVEYDIKEAIDKAEAGEHMVSLASGRTLDLKSDFTKKEILGKWIEIY